MRAIEHSVEEEPLIKKAKLIDKVENCHEVSMLPLNETVVKGNEEVCLLDMEDKKETCVEVESNERKKEEVSVSSLVDRKHVVSGDENVEKKEEGSVISAVTSSDEVPVVKNNDSCVVSGDETVEKNEEGCVILTVTSSDEVPVVKNNDSCVVSGEETIEKNKEGSVISAVTSNDEVPVVKNNDSCVVSGDETVEKNEEGCVILAVTSSDEVPVVKNNDSCVVFGGISGVNSLVLRKKLLVLDLNGLLADIVTPLKDVPADINIGRRAIFKRPFCDEFLRFCFDKFEVGIWSSRKQNNVVRITEFLLGDLKSKLLFCWDMSYCATTSVGSLENRYKYVVFKDLNRIWEKHDPRLPWKMGDYNETNTVLLDDSPYKALLNPPYTAIFPHSYNHQNKTDTSLGNGGDLRLHLEKLVEAENVQDFIKKNPFGQEAITEVSESWEFYREIIRMLRISSQTYRLRNIIR
ncbi:unnamed protein product [Arabidopsis thaliana]|uniref:Mitochondrial import inner membrane translocase subunit TIM50 n=1 Tax=Arabidopsis thaliana TaxID=3702 RepID=A0A5S9XGW0_ARATH|nr:unnamed protein product [Arabidopsis thaliana]